jgi:MFS family permease
VGQALVATGLASVTYAIIEAGERGLPSPDILGLLLVALASFLTLVRYESRRQQPLLDMRFFASAPFTGASAIAVCAYAALGAFLFLNTLYLQDVRGLTPLHAGLYMLPMAAMMIVFAPLSARLLSRRGARPSLLFAGCALAASGTMLTQLAPTTSVGYLMISYLLFGVGSGLVNPVITTTAVSAMPPSQGGVAAGVASTSRQVGQTLGVAIAGAVAGGGLSGALRSGFTAATRPAWWIIAGLGLSVLVLGFVTTSGWAEQTARATAERFRDRGPEALARS